MALAQPAPVPHGARTDSMRWTCRGEADRPSAVAWPARLTAPTARRASVPDQDVDPLRAVSHSSSCRSHLRPTTRSAQGRPNACRLSRDGPEREAWHSWRPHGERVSCRHPGAPFGSVRLFGDSPGRTVRADACEASASSNPKSPQPSGLRRTDVRCGRAILREGRQRRSSRGRERQQCVELLVTPWISVTEQHGRREDGEQPDGHEHRVWREECQGRRNDAQRDGETDERNRRMCSELPQEFQSTRLRGSARPFTPGSQRGATGLK